MKRILHIVSSPRGEASDSNKLSRRIIEKLQETYPGSSVKVNNVLEKDYEHLSAGHLAGYFTPAEQHTPEIVATIQPSEDAVDEIIEADIIVIATPLYNFNIPSALKAWVDHIIRAGRTFSYKTGQSEGLLKGRKVYLAVASNGVYSEGPMKDYDFAVPYLRFILGFIGLTDITVFRIEGSTMPGYMETALQKGLDSVAI